METQTEPTERSPSILKQYRKHRTVTKIGETVEIPGGAEGVTIADLSPFGNSVQVSWLLPYDHNSKGVVNTPTVHAIRTHYTDDLPVEIPYWAWGVTVYEPPGTNESVIYWLE